MQRWCHQQRHIQVINDWHDNYDFDHDHNINEDLYHDHDVDDENLKSWSGFPRLDLTMGGQDCNTQSAVSEKRRKRRKSFMWTNFQSGVYTNTVVVQRHSVVMTKTDKIYKVIFLKPCFDEISINIFSTQVRCTYDTSSKNITFGMMPIRFKFYFGHCKDYHQ